MFQTSPIIITSLKLKDVMNFKQEPTYHAINVEARKIIDDHYQLIIGAPQAYKFGTIHVDLLERELESVVEAYCNKNRVNTEIEKGEIERLKKLLR